ncbi:MAG: NYN domain-containing protein [Candidatus Yanofskybacteria bacterium]|nr:NYN domain-containing protein [Candidatus Yanofskybacteria bacterium]
MRKSPKQHLQLKDLFILLCSLKNSIGWVQAPNGRALIKHLSEETKVSPAPIGKKIQELEKLGYIQEDFHGNTLWRIRILIPEWDESRLPKKQETARSEPASKSPKPAKPQEKRFAVFMDYKNLEMNLPRSTDKFRNFSWLLDPILNQGKIIFAFVFIPDHYVSRAPIMQLTHKHHFHAIFCPRQINGVTTKDADTVDAQMQELAWALIQNSDITDVVIVTGDSDFQRLATHAKWQQKRVWVVSAEKAVSGRFLEMAQDGSLALQLVM